MRWKDFKNIFEKTMKKHMFKVASVPPISVVGPLCMKLCLLLLVMNHGFELSVPLSSTSNVKHIFHNYMSLSR
jgi:hypothetical protein